jgi:hypothetical protein
VLKWLKKENERNKVIESLFAGEAQPTGGEAVFLSCVFSVAVWQIRQSHLVAPGRAGGGGVA